MAVSSTFDATIASRPRSRVFRQRPPNALGFHTVQIDCMPNSGCTLFALFLCSQLAQRSGRSVACFPDVFDGQAALPERANESSTPRDHHYVAKMKVSHLWSHPNGTDAPHPPCEVDGRTLAWRAWERVQPTARILFVRDPLQNYLSLRAKRFCEAGGGMRAKFLLTDHLYGRAMRLGHDDYYDAVLHAEDMADAPGLVRTLAALLGVNAVGDTPRPIGTIAAWLDGAHRALARDNQALGYCWGGDVHHPTAKRAGAIHGAGNPVRYGTGNAYVDRSNRADVPFYQPRLKSFTANEAALVSALAPRMAAAYRPAWGMPSPVPRRQVRGTGLVARVCDGCLWRKGCRNDRAGPRVQLVGLKGTCACSETSRGWATELRGFDPRIKEKLKPALFRCTRLDELPASTGARASLYPSVRCALAPLPRGQGGAAQPLLHHALERCHAAFAELSARVTADLVTTKRQ